MRLEVYEAVLNRPVGDEVPDVSPIIIGPNYIVVDEFIKPKINGYIVYESLDDTNPDFYTELPWADDPTQQVALQKSLIKVEGEISLPYPRNGSEKLYIDDAYEVYYEGPEDHRITINYDHLVDEDANFLDIGVEKGDYILLPNGLKLMVEYVTIHKLYFASDYRFESNIDLPAIMYRLASPLGSQSVLPYVVDLSVSGEYGYGVLRFEVLLSFLDKVKFYGKYATNDPIQIKKYSPGDLSVHIDNPLGLMCDRLYKGAFSYDVPLDVYYIPLPDATLESYLIARERLDDRGYSIVLLNNEREIIEAFRFTNDDLKITLTVADLPETKTVIEGSGGVI